MILNAIYSRLSNSTELTDIIGDSLYAVIVPEKVQAPAVAYNAVSNPQATQSGYAYSEDSVEILCLSKEYDQGAAMAQIVANLFYRFGYNADGVVVQYSKVDTINRGYNGLYEEYKFIINITFKSKIT